MNPSLENPFRPVSQRATKRLFKGGDKQKDNATKVTKEELASRLEQTKVKYGPHEILYPQVQFLKNLEKLIPKELLDKEQKTARDILINGVKVDMDGNIIVLAIYFLKLAELPNLDKLIKLQKLDCSDNNLQKLPSLEKLTNLQYLFCYDNYLTELPHLDKLINLLWLNCFSNKLQELPSLDKLINLQQLLCSRNKLQVLPSLTHLINLQMLDCTDNLFNQREVRKIKEQVTTLSSSKTVLLKI